MQSNYRKLGGFIHQVDTRNNDARLGEENLYGISVTKEFIISHANLVGVTFESYKVVAPCQFAYIPDTSRRGDKIAISLNTFGEDIIVSSICSVFKIIDENQLLPEYLMLWFMRPEFDRYARFMSNGSAREVFDWDCMCNVELPVTSIDEQRRIVHDYQVITDRIELLQKINEKLYSYLNTQFERIASNVTSFIPLSSLCDYVTKKEYYKNLPEQNYLSTENLLQNKRGIAGFSEIKDDVRVTRFQEHDTLIANIRPYFKKIWFATVSGGCDSDVLCFRAHASEDACLLNAVLYQDKFFDYVMSGAKGTKMPRGDKNHIMQYPVPSLSQDKKNEFLLLSERIQSLQAIKKREIDVLQSMKVLFVNNITKGA